MSKNKWFKKQKLFFNSKLQFVVTPSGVALTKKNIMIQKTNTFFDSKLPMPEGITTNNTTSATAETGW